ncbi:hypothetical protein Glove_13g233 [Diversispora epigaea]|uniref:Uncharacterized protein n=1 Tax=Diversispora epigaea TaxID=1348612 RepID=A0A397JMN8_9GLOM|nr:hypothetical protein Glove_13g233 [Diversispora epigaea]
MNQSHLLRVEAEMEEILKILQPQQPQHYHPSYQIQYHWAIYIKTLNINNNSNLNDSIKINDNTNTSDTTTTGTTTTKKQRRRKIKASIGSPIINNRNNDQYRSKMVIFTVVQIVELEKLRLGEEILEAKFYFLMLVVYKNEEDKSQRMSEGKK